MASKEAKKNNSVKKPFADSLNLPSFYSKTNLALIARDPHWIYAYWEVAPSAIEEIRDRLGAEFDHAVRVLRLYDVTCIDFNGSNAHRQFDIDVGLHTSNWYVNLWSDAVSYCADLGFRLPDGRFLRLARSNFVTTPRVNSSNRRDEIWMKVEEKAREAPYVVAKRGRTAHRGNGRNRKRRISLTEADVRAYYSGISPLLKDIISKRLARRGRRQPAMILARSNTHNLFTGMFTKKKFLGASEFGGASESFPGASEQQPPSGRKFFFELGAELIVYGRTEPDAKVYWGDKNIELRPDGTFGMRLALPDGRIPLGFTAISGDNVEKRKISTAVDRERTQYV